MIIDVNTYIGHWPFRRLRYNRAEDLVRRMDNKGIDNAIVSSLHGVFYKNAHASNKELSLAVRPFRGRLIPFATLNPTYPGWREDLQRCAQDLGMRGLRLYPGYHGYAIGDEPFLELVKAAADLGWPIQIPQRLVDRRQRHRWDLAEDITAAAYSALTALCPDAKWMILSSLGLDGRIFSPEASLLIDICRYDAVLRRSIQGLIDSIGIEYLAFGTGMPFKVPEAALLKLELLDLTPEDRECIAWRNAAWMLDLET